MKRLIAAALLIVVLGSMLFSRVPSARAQAYYITCSSTHWVTMVSSGWADFGGGAVLEDALIQALRDTNNNAYCGEIRAVSLFQNNLGYDEYFNIDLWEGISYVHHNRVFVAPGSGSVYGSQYAAPDGSWHWYAEAYIGSTYTLYYIDTGQWTVN